MFSDSYAFEPIGLQVMNYQFHRKGKPLKAHQKWFAALKLFQEETGTLKHARDKNKISENDLFVMIQIDGV